MVPVGGGGLRHSLIVTNVAVSLHTALRGSGTDEHRLVAYRDVTVICGPPEFLDAGRQIVKHPDVVVEVLSPATRNLDQGEKARPYRQLPSLREFLLVEQEQAFVEHCRRLPDGSWQIVAHAEETGVIHLDSLEAVVTVAQLYSGVDVL